ncbi:Uncharacterised protein [Serratia quinivorans]|uniref:Uncharacterized protein n=1 Tax=Serratia quinivorans TaxID=137545 RepID=A0A380ARQ9_9GAMM|nr:hypothetical protein [Serratia proteamaculans]RYM59999.1 hypothetical protein BSR03_16220 [Serratia proteamaculans]SUI86093.1 Uncharacterised protein [Serratia quinivorans]
METNWEDERAAFMAGEIGEAVMQLVMDGSEINEGNIVDYLELKRKTVGNTIHKGVLRDAAAFVRRGNRA